MTSAVPATALRRVCIVGSGPAGFYTAESVLRAYPTCHVEMIEQLPVPFGLVRYGVAPDHPEVKIVSKVFSKLADSGRFRFWGNCSFGTNSQSRLTANSLLASGACDAVVFAYGASRDRLLGIPGEHHRGFLGAREFVSWYNGHPMQSSEDALELDQRMLSLLTSTDTATVIGNGNVALDCARILLSSGTRLQDTDIPRECLSVLQQSTVKRVVVVGRRGPIQSSFTNKELREVVDMASHSDGSMCVQVDPQYLQLNDASIAERDQERAKKRQWDLWLKMSPMCSTSTSGSQQSLEFRFLRSPVSFDGSTQTLRLAECELQGEAGKQRAVLAPSTEPDDLRTGLVLRSIGYQSERIDESIPFDEKKCIVPSQRGMVSPSVFVSGWIKRGPEGIIGTNKWDAEETVETMVQRAVLNEQYRENAFDTVMEEGQQQGPLPFLSWSHVERILNHEHEQGYKLRLVPDMLRVAGVSHNA